MSGFAWHLYLRGQRTGSRHAPETRKRRTREEAVSDSETYEADVNGDGVDDTIDVQQDSSGGTEYLIDTNGDGTADVQGYDEDSNGTIDYVEADTNGDGTADVTGSLDENGNVTYAEADTDGDGTYDTAVEQNSDGSYSETNYEDSSNPYLST